MRKVFLVSLLGAILGLWIALVIHMLPGSRAHDFLNLYTGATLAKNGDFARLHDTSVQLSSERQVIPATQDLIPFVRPLFYAILLEPLALLQPQAAFSSWIVLQSVLLAGCWLWGVRRFGPEAMIPAVLFLPSFLGIGAGQDSAVLLVLLIAAYELHERGRPAASGATLALTLMKFHLVLLWPLALAISRRWRMLAGFCAMAALEVAVTLAAGGLADARLFVALLRNRSLANLSPAPERMVSYQGLAANLGIEQPWFAFMIIAAVISILLITLRNAPSWKLFTLTPIACLIIVPHVYGYDLTLLLLPIWLTLFRSKLLRQKIAAFLFSTPFPFGSVIAGPPLAAAASASLLALFFIVSADRGKTV